MSFRKIVTLVVLAVAVLAMLGSRVFAQTQTASQQVVGTGSPLVGNLTPEGREKLKGELEGRLEALKKSNPAKEKLEAAQANFSRVLKVLADLEATEKAQGAHLVNAEQIGKRLEEAKAVQQSLEKSVPEEFNEYTEQLRTEYKSQLTALQSEIEVISKRSTQGGVRVTRIAEEIKQLEARSAEIDGQLQKLGYAAAQVGAPGDETQPMPEGQELDLQL